MTFKQRLIFKLDFYQRFNGLTSRDIATILKIAESYVSHMRSGYSYSARLQQRIELLITAFKEHRKKNKKVVLFGIMLNETSTEAIKRKKETIEQFKKDYNLIF